MKIKLLSDRILVKPNAIEERNSFGIILPENQKKQRRKCCGYWSQVKEELKVRYD
jgi:co-chaperonin GroES (HSP10)